MSSRTPPPQPVGPGGVPDHHGTGRRGTGHRGTGHHGTGHRRGRPRRPAATAPAGGLRAGTAQGRAVLLVLVLASGMAFLDGTVVNVALPSIGADLGADVAGLQWTVTAYLLTLSSLILLGGSLGDRYGRRRVLLVGAVAFAVASAGCALAPDVPTLVAARAVQGVGGALLTPGGLAVLQASFAPQDRARAIGTWSGLTGVAGAAGPVVGGWLVAWDWRAVFLLNLPLAAAVVVLGLRHVPESRSPERAPSLDVPGAVASAVGLGGLTYALVAGPEGGWGAPSLVAAAVGVVGLAAFVLRERRTPHPVVPPSLFSSRVFTVVNVGTFAVYAALSGVMLLLVLQLQVSLGWSALAAGAAMAPSTLLLLLLSGRSGAAAARTGPRLPLVVGPLVAAVGVALLAGVGPGDTYPVDVLPGVLLLGAGLVITVAPLTATVLAAAPDALSGTASGVNNAVARSAGLVAVAALPAVVGLTGAAYADPALLTPAYRAATLVCAGLLALGALVALVGVPGGRLDDVAPRD
ncbi:DHA2 family efflux MFS transporter permease subunit [uncultured Pseudokineococcus sp.]|uniref:DHA2 family efflux MFS transporter permease subunit n=1 Tax=uncultured Pseudokineococcus sp. TaxID=1642928 RepID=UPI00262C44F6|nr:DHA2 family efflux MFS transporter permease subunit [uncultured Pseudokineococcus sp.]